MPIRIVQSKQNARLKELRKALANPGKNERGLVGIEGPNLVAEAMRAGLRVNSVFVGGDGVGIGFSPELAKPNLEESIPDIDVLLVSDDALKPVLNTESPQLVAALVEPRDWTWAEVTGKSKETVPLVIVLAGIQDPGNLGTILRSAEAFGADGVVCLPGTANVWNPKAVRASAGSVFRVPVLYADERETFGHLRKAGVRILTTTVQGARPADRVNLAEPVAVLIGNEGNGVPADLAAKADGAITIPCPGPVESLNAAVATSVLLYEAARQREAARQKAAHSGVPKERRGGTR